MILHEVPHDSGPLDCLPGAFMLLHEGIVVPIVASALDHLSPTLTPCPDLARPSAHSIYFCGICVAVAVAIHLSDPLGDGVWLLFVIVRVPRYDRVMRPWVAIQ